MNVLSVHEWLILAAVIAAIGVVIGGVGHYLAGRRNESQVAWGQVLRLIGLFIVLAAAVNVTTISLIRHFA